MRVLVLGGTGFLGTFLLPKLIKCGYDLTVLTRSLEKTTRLESRGIRTVIGDLLHPEALISRLHPQDAVISIAMPEIKPGRISRRRLRQLQEQTTSYFSTPIAIAEKFGCPLVVTLGTSFSTMGEDLADESWPIERRGIARIGEFVDPLLADVIDRGSPPLIQILPGQIYGPGGLFKKLMYEWMKKGKYRVVGAGNNHIPRIHVEDCAEAYVKVLEKMPVGNRFIISDDESCTVREFSDYMAESMHVPKPKSVPGRIIRVVLGRLMHETVTMNCRVSNSKAKKFLDWQPEYPSCREGLPATIQELEIIRQDEWNS